MGVAASCHLVRLDSSIWHGLMSIGTPCRLLRWRLPPGQTPSPQDEDTLLRMLESFHCKAIREAPGSKAGYSYEVKCQLLRQETYNASGVKQVRGVELL